MKCTFGVDADAGLTGHDWVLVANRSADITVDNDKGLLWACPCGEFRWTSYAEWEPSDPQPMVAMTNNPNQGESTAAGHITP
ncbi:MAG: hypothetical protein IH822_06335 [Chloroflexi bacterium]|nr:hypothetical protein [Chloroflexota bacterium]